MEQEKISQKHMDIRDMDEWVKLKRGIKEEL